MRLAKLLLFTSFTFVLASCVGNKMYRPVSVQVNDDFTLAFVEFDDQGEMWAPDQLSRALSVIKRANEHEQGSLVITYIHGWQHNASPKNEEAESGNVNDFKEFLAQIGESEQARAGKEPRPIVGIYLGWRGKSGAIPGLNFFTFYSRSGAARRIAGTSSTEVILRLLTTAKRNPQTRTILLGHSFGGQIVERALTQAMVGGVLAGELDEAVVPADLVVLINPASKSIQAKQFVEMLDRSRIKLYRRDREGNRFNVPLIVSVTSSADLATRWAFPAGLALTSLSKNFHKYPEDSCVPFKRQKSFYVRTPGHNKALLNHEVKATPLSASVAAEYPFAHPSEWLRSELDPVTGQRVLSFDGRKHRYTIRPIRGAPNDTPYWIMQVPKALIPGHSGFFTFDTLRLIGALLVLTGALEPDVITEMVRYDGVQPTSLVALPDGRVFVADASRRIYRVAIDSPIPFSFGCLPKLATPVHRIGLVFQGDSGLAARSRPTAMSTIRGSEEYKTELVPITVDEESAKVGEPRVLKTTQQFSSATFDVDQNRLFLVTADGDDIYKVDLVKRNGQQKEIKSPVPELWINLEGRDSVTALLFEPQTRSLYAASGRSGALYRITEGSDGPEFDKVADSLGLPVALAADSTQGHLYVGDAEGGRVWRLDCRSAISCSQPALLTDTEHLVNPSRLTVAPDGNLWVGDLEAERIVALSPEGEILQVIATLPAE